MNPDQQHAQGMLQPQTYEYMQPMYQMHPMMQMQPQMMQIQPQMMTYSMQQPQTMLPQSVNMMYTMVPQTTMMQEATLNMMQEAPNAWQSASYSILQEAPNAMQGMVQQAMQTNMIMTSMQQEELMGMAMASQEPPSNTVPEVAHDELIFSAMLDDAELEKRELAPAQPTPPKEPAPLAPEEAKEAKKAEEVKEAKEAKRAKVVEEVREAKKAKVVEEAEEARRAQTAKKAETTDYVPEPGGESEGNGDVPDVPLAVTRPRRGAAIRTQQKMAESLRAETTSIDDEDRAEANKRAAKRAKRDSASPTAVPLDSAPLELRYFGVMAKGLGPALVLEHSGLTWLGNAGLGFRPAEQWQALKPTTPFGQMPVLSKKDGFQLAQTVAIINYVARLADTDGASSPAAFGISQMLMAEGEDLYSLMSKFVPTVNKKLSTDIVMTSKGTRTDYDEFWGVKLPAHLARLEELCPFNMTHATLPGELYLWSILYQCVLIDAGCLVKYAGLRTWYDALKADAKTERVLSGKSSMGTLKQYFVSADSKQCANASDGGGRWG